MDLSTLKVNKSVDEQDGMLHGMPDYYFMTGRDALDSIMKCLAATSRSAKDIERVLDYACGYGRVLRWLLAGFPQSKVIGVDMDAKAVASARKTLGANTRVLDKTLNARLDAPFDLIWVGSLFTHLTEAEAQRVLIYLHAHLRVGAVLVLTTHGTLVANRIRTGERLYGLDGAGATGLLESYDANGYGFSAYPKMDEYGISLVTHQKMTALIEAAGLNVVRFEPQGWVKHQDVFGITRSS